MTNERKEKLLRYLFPNEQIRLFMCNDLYMELLEIIPKKLFIHTKNKYPPVELGVFQFRVKPFVTSIA